MGHARGNNGGLDSSRTQRESLRTRVRRQPELVAALRGMMSYAVTVAHGPDADAVVEGDTPRERDDTATLDECYNPTEFTDSGRTRSVAQDTARQLEIEEKCRKTGAAVQISGHRQKACDRKECDIHGRIATGGFIPAETQVHNGGRNGT